MIAGLREAKLSSNKKIKARFFLAIFSSWKKYIDILKREENNVIFHNNILESHLYRGSLHLNSNGTAMPAGNFILRIRRLWCDVDSNREQLPNDNNITLTSNVEPLINLNVINPDDYFNVSVRSILKFYRSKYPNKLIIGHSILILLGINLRS